MSVQIAAEISPWEIRVISLKRSTDPPGLKTATEGVAADADHLYVTLYHYNPDEPKISTRPGQLVMLRAADGVEVARITVGHQPRHVAVDPLRNRAYVVNFHQDSYSVSVIDTAERKVRTTIQLGQVPIHVASSPERNRVYVTNPFQGKVHVISGPDGSGNGESLLTSLVVAPGVLGVAIDDNQDKAFATIAHQNNGTFISQIAPINTATNAVGTPVNIPQFRADAEDVVVDPVTRNVFVINLGMDQSGLLAPKISVFNAALQLFEHIPLPTDASHLAFDHKTRQVLVCARDNVQVIDADTRKVVSVIATPPFPRGVAVTPVGSQVIIGDSLEGQLTIATPVGVGPHDLSFVRPDDLMQLDFDFVNLRVDAGPNKPAKLVRVDPAQAALIIVNFAPQHVAERVLSEDQEVSAPLQSRIAGESRLAFRLPNGVNELPYTLESLLDWSKLEPSLVPAAVPSTTFPAVPPPIVEPSAVQTAIELPYRLTLSPDATVRWEHSAKPVTRNSRTELWHTRARVANAPRARIPLRAVYSPDFPANTTQFPFNTAVNSIDRRQIVKLSSDFTLAGPSGNKLPRPVSAEQLMLTALGGYIRLRGNWNPQLAPGQSLNLTSWRHLATLGRDHNVRLTTIGSLLPFGHRAVKIKATEREIVVGPNIDDSSIAGAKSHFAALRQREFIVIIEAEKRFDLPDVVKHYDGKGREMPIRSVRIDIGETPDLAPPDLFPFTNSHWVKVGSSDFQFPLTATDVDGEIFTFSAPMIFVPITDEAKTAPGGPVHTAYVTDQVNNAPRRTASVNGQTIAYAPRAAATNDAARLVTERVLFKLKDVVADDADGVPYIPLIEKATARIFSVEAITGVTQASEVTYFQPYLQGQIDGAANQATVFMKLTEPISLDLPAETAGGLAKTALEMSGLSRTLGPLPGDVLKLAKGEFHPDEIFNDLSSGLGAKLLGVLDLKSILDTVLIGGDTFRNSIPKMVSETKRLANNIPQSVVTKLDWSPTLKDSLPFKATLAGKTAVLAINTSIEQKLEPGAQPTYSVEGTLTNFQIDFANVLQINFASLKFTSRSGQKTEVRTDLASLPLAPPIAMAGALRFLDKLREQLPPDLLGQLPKVDVSQTGVVVSTSIGLPPLAFGAFVLQNVILGARLTLPFVDEPAKVRFNFGTREQMFTVTVLAVGGGGFVGIEVALDRVIGIEAALEFGGNATLNLGIAAASVFAMAGFYFRYADDGPKPKVDFTGYIRYGGSVTVLGFISVGIEFYLGLTYRPEQNIIEGQAAVTVSFRVAFFKKKKSLSVSRRFKGLDALGDIVGLRALADGGDGASFGDIFAENDWKDYVAAFA
jgi:YVTN family beta-propeller protein